MEKNDTISILYVEDQDDVRLFLSKILSRHYTNIFLAENGKQGLELFKEHKPDIIISDIKMPVMDGLSMSSRIKEIDPRAKIILTTAHSDMEYFIQSIDVGITQYILKPIDREKLFNAINTCKEQVLLEREVKRQNEKLRQNNDMLTRQERELRQNLQKTIALKEIIAKSEENFRRVAENIQDAFWLKDQNKIIFVNKAFESLFEISQEEIYDNPDILKDFIYQPDAEEFLSKLAQHEQDQSKPFSAEFRIKTPSGAIKNIWYRDIFIEKENASEKRRLCTLSDITWRINNERLFRDLLLVENEAKIKERLLANVSHEMRTPLNGLFALGEIMSATNLDPQQKEYLATMIKAGEELLELTNNLLNISELEQNRVTVKKQLIETPNLFKPLLARFSEKAEKKAIDFDVEYAPKFPVSFISDPLLITQLLEPLFDNAVKFTQKGGISINISAQEKNEDQWNLIVRIIDTGVGIKKNQLERIFNLFTQQEEADSRNFEGLGIGLAISKRIVSLLKGSIDVISYENQGSTFTVNIPVDKNTCEINKTTRGVPQLNLKVLYAEDKEVNQKIFRIMLQNAGCKVDIAPNGKVAFEMATKNQYDIILMDIQMPVMDGITATQKIRENQSSPPPIIGISANALRENAKYYIDQGLDDYLSKPVSPSTLYTKICEWIQPKNHAAKWTDMDPSEELQPVHDNLDNLPELDDLTIETLREQAQFDDKIIKDLFSTFLDEAQMLINKLEKGINDKDQEAMKENAHALKGLFATVGASRCHHIAAEMDKYHKGNYYNHSIRLFHLLKSDFQMLKPVIESNLLTGSK